MNNHNAPTGKEGIGMKYESTSVTLHTEQDEYENGCIPNTGRCVEFDWPIKADSLKDWARQAGSLCLWRDATLDDMEFYEDEPGRIDIQTLNTRDNHPAQPEDIRLWKEGKKKLWCATYTFRVQTVTRDTPTLLAAW
jgi:hypothetical protein